MDWAKYDDSCEAIKDKISQVYKKFKPTLNSLDFDESIRLILDLLDKNKLIKAALLVENLFDPENAPQLCIDMVDTLNESIDVFEKPGPSPTNEQMKGAVKNIAPKLKSQDRNFFILLILMFLNNAIMDKAKSS